MECASKVPRTVDTLTFQNPLYNLIFQASHSSLLSISAPLPFSDLMHTLSLPHNKGEIKGTHIKYCMLKISDKVRLFCLFYFFAH